MFKRAIELAAGLHVYGGKEVPIAFQSAKW